jgi:hypothetical protein
MFLLAYRIQEKIEFRQSIPQDIFTWRKNEDSEKFIQFSEKYYY